MDDAALNGAFLARKNYGVQISSKKRNPFVTDEFSSETLILRKIVHFVHEVHPVFFVTLSTF